MSQNKDLMRRYADMIMEDDQADNKEAEIKKHAERISVSPKADKAIDRSNAEKIKELPADRAFKNEMPSKADYAEKLKSAGSTQESLRLLSNLVFEAEKKLGEPLMLKPNAADTDRVNSNPAPTAPKKELPNAEPNKKSDADFDSEKANAEIDKAEQKFTNSNTTAQPKTPVPESALKLREYSEIVREAEKGKKKDPCKKCHLDPCKCHDESTNEGMTAQFFREYKDIQAEQELKRRG